MNPSGRSFRFASLVVLVSLVGAQAAAAAKYTHAPDAVGPFPVGVTTLVLRDYARADESTGKPRTLVTEIWYPATNETRDLEKNLFTDFLMRSQVPALSFALQMAFKQNPKTFDAQFKNLAVRDARGRDGKFPLIVFSHGNGGIRMQSTFWCDYMASHGYVVMSCDHTGNAAVTVVDGMLVLQDPKQREQAAIDRPLDVSFLIDSMERMARGEDSRFAGRIDLDRIGVAGHSFGGYTSGAVINADERVRAIIPMSPVFGERENYSVPLLLILGSEDATIGTAGNERARKYYEETKADKFLVELVDAGHFSFSDMFQIDPEYGDGVGQGERVTAPGEKLTYLSMDETYAIVNSYSAAFFGVYLKDSEEYDEYLAANHFSEKIIHRAEKMPEKVEAAAGAGAP